MKMNSYKNYDSKWEEENIKHKILKYFKKRNLKKLKEKIFQWFKENK